MSSGFEHVPVSRRVCSCGCCGSVCLGRSQGHQPLLSVLFVLTLQANAVLILQRYVDAGPIVWIYQDITGSQVHGSLATLLNLLKYVDSRLTDFEWRYGIQSKKIVRWMSIIVCKRGHKKDSNDTPKFGYPYYSTFISVANIQNPFPLHLVKLRNRALKFLVLISLVCLEKYPKAHEKWSQMEKPIWGSIFHPLGML